MYLAMSHETGYMPQESSVVLYITSPVRPVRPTRPSGHAICTR